MAWKLKCLPVEGTEWLCVQVLLYQFLAFPMLASIVSCSQATFQHPLGIHLATTCTHD